MAVRSKLGFMQSPRLASEICANLCVLLTNHAKEHKIDPWDLSSQATTRLHLVGVTVWRNK